MNDTARPPLTVSELMRQAKNVLEHGLSSCWVRGEVTNLSRAASGHWYFSLKDANCTIRCVMFRARNQFVESSLRDGEQIDVRAQPSLYEARGDFQLIVDALRRVGAGALFETFLRLKESLRQEGLFDPGRKKPLPRWPKGIGIVCSPHGAALHDVLVTLKRRWPLAVTSIFPCPAQGSDAPAQIRHAIERANQSRMCDLILLVRGGGSYEDLATYNDEGLVRAIAASALPIVTGIGHETDITLADYAADLHAHTPTSAAERGTPDIQNLHAELRANRESLYRAHLNGQLLRWQKLDELNKRLIFPDERLNQHAKRLREIKPRLRMMIEHGYQSAYARLNLLNLKLSQASGAHAMQLHRVNHVRIRLDSAITRVLDSRATLSRGLSEKLEILSPYQTLQRGYAIVMDQYGRIVTFPGPIKPGDPLTISISGGDLKAICTETFPQETTRSLATDRQQLN